MMKKMISLLVIGMLNSSLLVGCQSTKEKVMYEDEVMKITIDEIVELKEDVEIEIIVENKTNETQWFADSNLVDEYPSVKLNGKEIFCNLWIKLEPNEIKEEVIILHSVDKEEVINGKLNFTLFDLYSDLDNIDKKEVEFEIYEVQE